MTKSLEKKIHLLPRELLPQVEEFVELLLRKRTPAKQRKLRMSWAGALEEFRDQYSSIELQKKALEWWGD